MHYLTQQRYGASLNCMLTNATHFNFIRSHCNGSIVRSSGYFFFLFLPKNFFFLFIGRKIRLASVKHKLHFPPIPLMLIIRNAKIELILPCKSTFNWCRTVVSRASVSMRHSNVAAISFRVNITDSIAFSVNKPFASGPSLVDIDSTAWRRRERKKIDEKKNAKI